MEAATTAVAATRCLFATMPRSSSLLALNTGPRTPHTLVLSAAPDFAVHTLFVVRLDSSSPPGSRRHRQNAGPTPLHLFGDARRGWS